jgi:hypothetical protein
MILACASVLGGCAFRTEATGMAVDYNDFVAQTTNRQTVLNILRAREREPMHFTSFGEVAGQIRGQGNASIGSVLNGNGGVSTSTGQTVTNSGATGAITGTAVTATRTVTDNLGATNFTPSLGIQITTGTDFRVAANATDEFYRGILNPIAPATVIHYLRQGFPADLLSHLLIGRLELNALITRPDGSTEEVPLKTINNNPDQADDAAEFTAAIRCRRLDYSIQRQPARQLPIQDLSSLAPIAPDTIRRVTPQAADAATAGAAPYQLQVPAQTNFTLLLSEPGRDECGATGDALAQQMRRWLEARGLTPRRAVAQGQGEQDRSGRALSSDARSSADQAVRASEREALGALGEVRFTGEHYFDDQLPEGWRGDLFVDVTLRSVQGILYYLGEYVRVGDAPLLEGDCGYCLPVLRILPLRDLRATDRFVEVSYRGTRYAVPLSGARLGREAGRSSQTIDIVQQLLNLNRRASDLPSTPLLRVTN